MEKSAVFLGGYGRIGVYRVGDVKIHLPSTENHKTKGHNKQHSGHMGLSFSK